MRKVFLSIVTIFCITLPATGKNGSTYSREKVIRYLDSLRTTDYCQSEVIVKLRTPLANGLHKSGFGRTTIDAILAQYPGIDIKPIFSWTKKNIESDGLDLSKYYSIRYVGPIDAKTVAKSILQSDEVEYAEPRPYLRLHLHPNDSLYSYQWNLPQIHMERAWDITQGDSTIVIAIVDTGVDWMHPDLAANMWTNPTDGSHGYDVYNEDNNPMPGFSHGTQVAGIAAAVTNNRRGVAGVAPKCKIMAVKASPDANSIDILHGYEGIQWATLHGAHIINCSWGGSFSLFGEEIVKEALAKGIVIVASAGNDGLDLSDFPQYPACYDGVLAVSATDISDKISSYSNYGYTVGVSAPGDQIESTYPNNEYITEWGTSFSSPVVAGVAALVKSLHKDFTARQIQEQIRVTSDPIDDNNPGYQYKLGFGRVNAYNALTAESPAIQVSSVSVSDSLTGNGNGLFEPGETVRISLFLTNYLKPSGMMTISIFGDPQFTSIPNSTASASGLGTLQTTLVPIMFDVTLSQNIPFNKTKVSCFVTITAGAYNDYCPISFVVNTMSRNHNINNITMSVGNNGNIGFNDYPYNLQGLGFRYKTTGLNNYLFEGGLMIGTDTLHLVDCVRGNDPTKADRDFTSNENYKLFTPGAFADQQGSGQFNTYTSAPKLNLRVGYSTYAWSSPLNENIVFVCYSIINNNDFTETISNMYAGLYLDWDIGTHDKNIASVDTALRLGYAYDPQQGDTAIYVGVVMLGTKPLAFRAISNNGSGIGNWGVDDGFTQTEKWDALHNGVSSATAGPKDISMVIGCGPFTIAQNQTASIPFAFVAARGLDSLKRVAAQAISLWHIIDIQNSHPNLSTLDQNFPNPFNSETYIRYLLPSAGAVSLKVYDILGREIAVLVDQYQQRGIYVISFPGRRNISSGIYFYQLKAAGSIDVKKMVLIK
jgi:subtilisin family serine protease